MHKTSKVGLLIPLAVAVGLIVQAPVPAAHAAVKKFVAGADLGLLPEMEAAGCAFDENGKAKDAVEILADAGVNMAESACVSIRTQRVGSLTEAGPTI